MVRTGARAGSGFILKGRIQIRNKSFWIDNTLSIPPSLALSWVKLSEEKQQENEGRKENYKRER
jgi:hypothetical protein